MRPRAASPKYAGPRLRRPRNGPPSAAATSPRWARPSLGTPWSAGWAVEHFNGMGPDYAPPGPTAPASHSERAAPGAFLSARAPSSATASSATPYPCSGSTRGPRSRLGSSGVRGQPRGHRRVPPLERSPRERPRPPGLVDGAAGRDAGLRPAVEALDVHVERARDRQLLLPDR